MNGFAGSLSGAVFHLRGQRGESTLVAANSNCKSLVPHRTAFAALHLLPEKRLDATLAADFPDPVAPGQAQAAAQDG